MRWRRLPGPNAVACGIVALCAGVSPASAAAAPGDEPTLPTPNVAPRLAESDAIVPPGIDLALTDAIALAMRNNRRLVNGRLDRAVQRFALVVAEDKFKPDVNIGSFQRFETEEGGWARDDYGATVAATLRLPTGARLDLVNAVAGGGFGAPGFDGALTLRFTQPWLKGGGIRVNTASVRIARATERIDALVFERAIGDVATAVVVAYRNLLQAEQRVGISARSLQRAQDLLATNRALIRAGRMAELEVVQAEADVAERELVLVGAENRLDRARLTLIDTLDVDTDAVLHPTETLNVDRARSAGARRMAEHCAGAPNGAAPEGTAQNTPPAGNCQAAPAPMIALALENRPEYQQALLRVQNAEAQLLLARNNRLWDLSTTVAMDVGANADSFGVAFDRPFGLVPDDDLRVALRLDVPIGEVAAKQRHLNARASLARARTDLAELRQSIDIDVRNAVRDVDARLRQVALASRASELAARKLQAERQKLNLGLTTNFRMIRFEDDLVRAQNSELEATISYLNALASLDQTLGTTLQTWGLEVEGVERLGDANAAWDGAFGTTAPR